MMSIEHEKMNYLLSKFTKFKNEQKYLEEDLTPYNVFGEFAIYLQDHVINNTICQNELDEAFCFFNEMAESDDKYIINLLVVGIFEVFTDEQKTIDLAHKKLSNKGRYFFDKTLSKW